MKLPELTRKLYRATGKLNLYIYFCDKTEKPDIVRLIWEIDRIKRLVQEIEASIVKL